MKRIIYIAILLMLTFSGCEYHPYYDGQPLRVFSSGHGLIEADGSHLYVPIAYRNPTKIEIYGGKGKNHTITVADPEYLGFSYAEADVDGGFMGEGILPAKITLNPLALGETTMTISDDDTGESIQIYVHVVQAYRMLEVHATRNSLPFGTVLAFEYLSKSDVVKIGLRDQSTGVLEHIVDAKYRFWTSEKTLAFELTYLADEEGQPHADGVETVRTFRVEYDGGDVSRNPLEMLRGLNLDYIPVQTRTYYDDTMVEYFQYFQFVDITDDENVDLGMPDAKVFYARSAQLGAWK